MIEFLMQHWLTLFTILAVFGALQGACAYLVLVERKVCAWMQDRIGPNRVGPLGLLQPLADGIKFLLKEEVVPSHVDKFLFLLAPCIAISTAMLAFSVVPFGATEPAPLPPIAPSPLVQRATDLQKADFQKRTGEYQLKLKAYQEASEAYRKNYQWVIAPNVDIGILFIFAISSLAVYGVILGGWSANNKYSMLGGLRSSAQIISYEIPLGLSVVGIVLLTGSLNLERIIWNQVPGVNSQGMWNIFFQPLAFLLFLISSYAECNRLPFDLPECEQELIGGYHTEYNGMKLALFLLGEYIHMITTSALMVILFFGGWHFPWIAEANSFWGLKFLMFSLKTLGFILLYMIIRWTLPRFRFDQLMSLAWTVLIPMALINLVAVMFVKEFSLTPWLLTLVSIAVFVGSGMIAAQPSAPRRRVAVS